MISRFLIFVRKNDNYLVVPLRSFTFHVCSMRKILFDGINAKDYNLAWLRSQIGVIPQEPVIFDGTVMDNVLYGKPDATMEEVLEACDTSCADEFITRLPQVGFC